MCFSPASTAGRHHSGVFNLRGRLCITSGGWFYLWPSRDVAGRKAVLITTLVIMGVTTALMGMLPGYALWGIWSPILLVALRFVQGIALGGEWAGAVLLSMEHGEASKRGRNASFARVGLPAAR